ncbi:hypothetical protein DVA86_32355 [Streptomyces armeniacus]|uniref:ATP-dependent DNA ligase family profile domain-containing protein n=2 Tax=Streptomyces armeniacus TaxID=83291 RepID=A0A345Y1Q7_9ACTN|nr:hypothetical protein DVA86_32355 [Streptomyces armeniacus]
MVLFRFAEGEAPPGAVAEVVLQSRTGRVVTGRYPDLAEAAAAILPPGTVLDGEAVVILGGRTDFGAVQSRAASSPARAARLARELPATFAAFDVLAVDGRDLRGAPYRERRARLVGLLAAARPPLQVVPVVLEVEAAAAMFDQLAAVGLEGVVCKRLDGRYRCGARDWLKVKHDRPRT